ncbi:hypothetical protein [Streptomyces sp. NPDC002185]
MDDSLLERSDDPTGEAPWSSFVTSCTLLISSSVSTWSSISHRFW